MKPQTNIRLSQDAIAALESLIAKGIYGFTKTAVLERALMALDADDPREAIPRIVAYIKGRKVVPLVERSVPDA